MLINLCTSRLRLTGPLSRLAKALASRGCRLGNARSATIFGPFPGFGPLAYLTLYWKNVPRQSKPDNVFSPVGIQQGECHSG